MTIQDPITETLIQELEVCFPLTEKQLLSVLRQFDRDAGLVDLKSHLESNPAFTLAGDHPRCWRLARPSDSGTEVCSACGDEKSNSRFRHVRSLNFDCEAQGRAISPKQPAQSQDPHFVGGLAPNARLLARQRRAQGYTDPHEGLVYITKGGSAYHLREDCEALRSGQGEAVNTGHRLHRVRLVPMSNVTAERHPCAHCAS
jgi:hypothetical protein